MAATVEESTPPDMATAMVRAGANSELEWVSKAGTVAVTLLVYFPLAIRVRRN
jgi:hypothetical protein